ncbi:MULTISPECIES: hypothetical protein [Moraxella]|uniref:Uncharacterized protein n=2 Tax=Moraxella lacunata TaxID=477 RepID=A0A1B8PWB9_MORLA|nr:MULTISPECIES: hypothetical protein [Moraxella]MBE9577748.1 hypothetical protein [Moraxella sp. K1664]MBE9587170.1 hypothetical protein [Moraxella sp. K1630]MBE9589453.1 hypothetical protein [Moraxella sp. K127]MBE9595454.1 hypothetical protein [Moraxella sp. K2450]MDI4482096.1 hypothetical protein [Moraxella lacunata]
MNIECNRCHAHNHVGDILIECMNCRADLSDVYLKQARSKQAFFSNLLKIIIVAFISSVISLLAYEFYFQDKIFSPTPRHSTTAEYLAINECMQKIQVPSGKSQEQLDICSEALQKLQIENPNLQEINPRMLDGYAQVILSQQ